MKKIVLSTVAIATMATMANASTSSDLKALKAQMLEMSKKIEALETKKTEELKAEKLAKVAEHKVPVLEFEGTHYLGFVSDSKDADSQNYFETRRNYFQVKGYFADNPKSYMRLTLDTFQNSDDGSDNGSWEVRVKYAFLYLDSVLPNTGVEIGQAHRPWIDYEEHHGWYYRSISKTFIEGTPDLINSSDLGINFKTKTPYFSSELGVFNGSGYHGIKNYDGMSAEGRLTAHLLGTGKNKEKKGETFFNVSVFGQYGNEGMKNSDPITGNYKWYGVHAVFNMPQFLIAAQYLNANEAKDSKQGDGWSVNAEIRPIKDISLFGKYDDYTLDTGLEKKRTIAGIGYQYNKNVQFIANYDKKEEDSTVTRDAIMLTAEVNW